MRTGAGCAGEPASERAIRKVDLLEGESVSEATRMERGLLKIDEAECKGCGLCIEACPPRVIAMGERLNHFGYRTAFYAGSGCTGCGICFLACPEPGAITVLRMVGAGPGHGASMGTAGGASACASN